MYKKSININISIHYYANYEQKIFKRYSIYEPDSCAIILMLVQFSLSWHFPLVFLVTKTKCLNHTFIYLGHCHEESP